MKLIEENGVLKIETKLGNESIHIIHCAETLNVVY